jgi:hypothetical protein
MKNSIKNLVLATVLAGAACGNATVFVDVSTLGDGITDTIGGATADRASATVLQKDQTWTRDRVYVLSRNTFIGAGVTLRIQPGTLIRCESEARTSPGSSQSADPAALIVARRGKLIAIGTADAPIIFTSIDDPHVPGGTETIPPYLNYSDSTNSIETIRLKSKQLKAGFTTIAGTPGVGEYEISGGTLQNVDSYAKTIANASLWSRTGKWGGIVWLGQANIAGKVAPGTVTSDNQNARLYTAENNYGLYPAEGMAEFSSYARGGGDSDADDQGVMRFVSNRYGGFVINGSSELNAFSFYGAGYNTVVEFIEDFGNKDDSFEFWGGCNSVKYAVSAFCGDDGFDTDAGWVGNAQFLLQIQNPKDNAAGAAATERPDGDCGDNLSENDGPEPSASYRPLGVLTLANATFIGRGYGSLGLINGEHQGPNFKAGAANKWYNNIVADAPFGAIAISGTEANGFYLNDATANRGYDGSATSVLNEGVSTNVSRADTNTPSGPYGIIKGTVFYRCGLAYSGTNATGVNTNLSSAVTSSYATFDQMFRSNNYARETGSLANHNKIATIEKIFGTNVVNAVNTNASNNTYAALENNNFANLNPGFTLPAYSRIVTNSLNLLPTNAIVRGDTNGYATIDRSLAPQLDQLTVAPFIGAARDNAWWMGWTMISDTGIFDSNQNAIAPTTVSITQVGVNPKVTFAAAPNVKYSIERSTDGKLFKSITIQSRSDLGNIEYTDTGATVSTAAVSYRVLAL